MKNKDLPLKQQQFCKYYVENKGNATKAYMKAFDIENSKTAKANGSRLLTNANIEKKIKKIMQEAGLNDALVNLELSYIIMQVHDLSAKLRGISEYNRLRKRYGTLAPKSKTQIHYDFSNMTLKEIESERQKLLN